MLNTEGYLKQIEMDTIQQEPLFTELSSEAAATVEGGVRYGRFTTKNVTSVLNIRRGPGTNYSIADKWLPNTVRLLQSPPARIVNGFRKFSDSLNLWVSTKYIRYLGPA